MKIDLSPSCIPDGN